MQFILKIAENQAESRLADSFQQMKKPEIVEQAVDMVELIFSKPNGVETAVSMINEVIREIRYN
jgi:hypothetical protein